MTEVSELELHLNTNSPVTTHVALGKSFTSPSLSQWKKDTTTFLLGLLWDLHNLTEVKRSDCHTLYPLFLLSFWW